MTSEELLIVSLKSSSFWSRENTCWAKEHGEDNPCQTFLFLLRKESTMIELQDKFSKVHLVPSTLHHTLALSLSHDDESELVLGKILQWTVSINIYPVFLFVCVFFFVFFCALLLDISTMWVWISSYSTYKAPDTSLPFYLSTACAKISPISSLLLSLNKNFFGTLAQTN